MPAVLFVCTANICRSPLAEVLFRDQLAQRGLDGAQWRVESAGTWGEDGFPASRNSCKVAQQYGLDLSQHRSRIVDADLLSQFDLILVMESGHKEALTVEFPMLAERIFLLSEMAGQIQNVEDPYGGPLSEYQATAEEMLAWIDQGWERIQRLAQAETE